jgi:protein disulfide-isomerase
MKMKAAALVVFLLFAAPLGAVTTGDTYDALLAEKGPPATKIVRGNTTVLTYPDAVIRVENGVVTSVKPQSPDYVVHATETAPANATPPAPAPADPGAATAELTWYADCDAALAKSRSSGRKLFVLFTKSGRSVWCSRFDEEIINQPEFRKYARDNLVLARLDLTGGTLTADQKVKGRELMVRLGVTDFPTASLLNPTGDLVGSVGYVKGGANAFLNRLLGL